MRQYYALLQRNRDMRFIWFAEVTCLIGEWFSQVVLLSLIVARSPGREGFAISSLILARFIPPLLLSPMAGVLLDRFNRQRILIWSIYLRAGIGVLYLIAVSDPSLVWLIYAGVIVQAAISTVYMPGQSALVASIVEPKDLMTANTLSNATWSAAMALGGALGGLVAALLGSSYALMIDIATLTLAGTLLMQVRGYKFTPRAVEVSETAAIAPDTSLTDGLRYVRGHRPTLATLFVKFGGSLGNVDSIMTILATQIFVLGANGQLSLGIFYSAFGIGAIIGPLISNGMTDGGSRSLRRWILIGFIGQALGWVLIGWASTIILMCFALLLRGMSGSINWTYSSVLLQRTTPDVYRGRVFSLDMALYNLATAFSTLVHGALIDHYNALNIVSIEKVMPASLSGGAVAALGETDIVIIAFGTALLSLIPLAGWVMAQRRWRDAPVSGLEGTQHVASA